MFIPTIIQARTGIDATTAQAYHEFRSLRLLLTDK